MRCCQRQPVGPVGECVTCQCKHDSMRGGGGLCLRLIHRTGWMRQGNEETLVPACHFCNDKKKARFPKKAEEQTLHPYYDNHLLKETWIRAVLDPGSPPALIYSVSPPATWPAVDQKRVERHFTVCGLATTYTSNANDELPPLKAHLQMLESRGGEPAVQAHLADQASSHAQRPNSWQFAMYRTLAADSWFTGGGFHLIA